MREYNILLKMIKIAQIILIYLTLNLSASAYAANLGMIDVISERGQPFHAVIPIASDVELTKFNVNVLGAKGFLEIGVIRDDFLNNFKIEITETGFKRYIDISSKEILHTIFFPLILNINYDGKNSYYSALVDYDSIKPKSTLLFGTKVFAENIIQFETQKAVRSIEISKSENQINSRNDISVTSNDIQKKDLVKSNVFKSKLYEELLGNLSQNEAVEKKVVEIESEIDILNNDLSARQKKLKALNDDNELYSEDIGLIEKINQSKENSKKAHKIVPYIEKLREDSHLLERNNELQKIVKKAKIPSELDTDNDTLEVSMGNPLLVSLLDDGRQINKELAVAAESQSTKSNILTYAFILALLLLMIVFYYNYKRRKALQEVFLGNFNNIGVDDGGNPYSKGFHKTLKNLLSDGKFDEAMKLFRYEFRYRGMSLYELCIYYATFQKYGITEFATDTFLEEIAGEHLKQSEIEKEVIIPSKPEIAKQSIHTTVVPERKSPVVYKRKAVRAKPQIKKAVDVDKSESIDLTDVSGDDVLTAKLNLATAYMNMGDSKKATKILNEVLSLGTAHQQREAKRLLNKLTAK